MYNIFLCIYIYTQNGHQWLSITAANPLPRLLYGYPTFSTPVLLVNCCEVVIIHPSNMSLLVVVMG